MLRPYGMPHTYPCQGTIAERAASPRLTPSPVGTGEG